jgi:hypothetical protein
MSDKKQTGRGAVAAGRTAPGQSVFVLRSQLAAERRAYAALRRMYDDAMFDLEKLQERVAELETRQVMTYRMGGDE